ncbi:acyltransferase family protein [Macrococcus equi]|uniref:acyltransferase family protein n=1 Tax=Macrococcus equi TaxID=3395462 RepID=UPI0039BE5ADE
MKRFEQLDVLRGLAALSVIISHTLAIFYLPGLLLEVSPLYIFWASHEAVIFFFTLSGFVLALSIINKKDSYKHYIIKRLFRIYVPYLVCIVFTFSCYYLFANKNNFSSLGAWIESKWQKDPNSIDLINHLLLIPNFDTTHYNPVIWSLVHELRISIIFPLIILALLKYSHKKVLIGALIVSIISIFMNYIGLLPSKGYHTSIFDTTHYVLMFVVGAILALNVEKITEIWNKQTPKIKLFLFIIGITLYIYSRAIYLVPSLLGFKKLYNVFYYFSDWGILLGSAIIIICAIQSKRLTKLLGNKAFVTNGQLSYSTYLYHTIIFLTVISVFRGKLSDDLIILISIVLTYIISYLSFKFIEIPSIKLGRKVIKK